MKISIPQSLRTALLAALASAAILIPTAHAEKPYPISWEGMNSNIWINSPDELSWTSMYNPDGEYFEDGDHVVFDGFGSDVIIEGMVAPGSITVHGGNYSFTGWGGIAGATSLAVFGGYLQLDNYNSYSGGTTVVGGSVTAIGTNSLGTGELRVDGGEVNIYAPQGISATTITGGLLNFHDTNTLASLFLTIQGGEVNLLSDYYWQPHSRGISITAGTLNVWTTSVLGTSRFLVEGGEVNIYAHQQVEGFTVTAGTLNAHTDGALGNGSLNIGSDPWGYQPEVNIYASQNLNGITIASGTLNATAVGALGNGQMTIDHGFVNISASQNLNGGITITSGTLNATAVGALGNGELNINGGYVDISASQYISGTNITAGVLNITVAGALGNGFLNICGLVGWPQTEVNISASQSLGDGITVTGGTLNATAVGALGNGSLFVNGGEVNISASQNLYRGITVTGGTLNATAVGALGYGYLDVYIGEVTISASQNIGSVYVFGGTLSTLADGALGCGELWVHGGVTNIGGSQNITGTSIYGGTLNAGYYSLGDSLYIEENTMYGGPQTFVNIHARENLKDGIIIKSGTLQAYMEGSLGTGALNIQGGEVHVGNFHYDYYSQQQYISSTTITDGTLNVYSYGALGTGELNINGGVVNIGGIPYYYYAYADEEISGTTISAGTLNVDSTVAGVLGTGFLNVSGGQVNIASAQNLSSTTISGGTVTLSVNGSLGEGIVTISDGTLDLGWCNVSNDIAYNGGTISSYGAYEGHLTVGANLTLETFFGASATVNADVTLSLRSFLHGGVFELDSLTNNGIVTFDLCGSAWAVGEYTLLTATTLTGTLSNEYYKWIGDYTGSDFSFALDYSTENTIKLNISLLDPTIVPLGMIENVTTADTRYFTNVAGTLNVAGVSASAHIGATGVPATVAGTVNVSNGGVLTMENTTVSGSGKIVARGSTNDIITLSGGTVTTGALTSASSGSDASLDNFKGTAAISVAGGTGNINNIELASTLTVAASGIANVTVAALGAGGNFVVESGGELNLGGTISIVASGSSGAVTQAEPDGSWFPIDSGVTVQFTSFISGAGSVDTSELVLSLDISLISDGAWGELLALARENPYQQYTFTINLGYAYSEDTMYELAGQYGKFELSLNGLAGGGSGDAPSSGITILTATVSYMPEPTTATLGLLGLAGLLLRRRKRAS